MADDEKEVDKSFVPHPYGVFKAKLWKQRDAYVSTYLDSRCC